MSAFERASWLLIRLFVLSVAVLCLLHLISLNFVREPGTTYRNACINNLRQIDAVKQQWALENNKNTNDLATLDDIEPLLVVMVTTFRNVLRVAYTRLEKLPIRQPAPSVQAKRQHMCCRLN